MQAIALLHPHHPPTFRLLVSTYSKKLGCGIAAAKNATDHSRCIHAAFTKGSAGNSEAYVRTHNNVVLQVVANSTWTTDQGQWPYGRARTPIEYVIPSATILIQNPIAVTKQGNTAQAQRFVDYLLSPAGQTIWVEKGYRPVISGVPGADKFPTPTSLFTIESLGGWKAVTKQFFAPETGEVTKIEQSLGVSTAK